MQAPLSCHLQGHVPFKMEMDESEVAERTFTFGDQAIRCMCRRDHEESAGVTLTLQMSVEEVWESFWNFGSDDTQQQQASQEHPPENTHPASVPGNAPASEQKPELLGLDVWPAAVRLCEYLSSCPQLVAGLDIAELGAGMGLPGLLCAKLGACSVFSSDCVDEVRVVIVRRSMRAQLTDDGSNAINGEPVVGHLQQNGLLNGLEKPAFVAQRLDWTDLSALQPRHLHAFRLVLAADVLYQNQLMAPLVRTMTSLLHPQGVILLGHLPRRAIVMERGIPTLVEIDEPYNNFRIEAEKAGLHCRVLSDGQGGGSNKRQPLLLAFALDPGKLEPLPHPESSIC